MAEPALARFAPWGNASASLIEPSLAAISDPFVAGRRVTVNFENAGRQTIDAVVVSLMFVSDDPRES